MVIAIAEYMIIAYCGEANHSSVFFPCTFSSVIPSICFFSMIPNQRELALRNSSNLLVINTIRLDPKFPDLGSHYCCIV
jgi:hypothetical protein